MQERYAEILFVPEYCHRHSPACAAVFAGLRAIHNSSPDLLVGGEERRFKCIH